MGDQFQFVPAEKVKRKARVAIIGPSGCGKTFSALLLARGIVGPEGRIAVIDTEHASASLYARITKFETLVLTQPFTPERYAAAAKAAVAAGFDILVIDSMSQEWNGEGGVLQMVEANKTRLRNDFAAWNGPSQDHERLIETLVSLPIHIVSTFQAKTDYAMTTDNGRTKVEKLGLGAITRDGVEYRYDLVLEMTLDHKAVVTKSRIPDFADKTISKPDALIGKKLIEWLDDGAIEATAPAPVATAPSNGNAASDGELRARAARSNGSAQMSEETRVELEATVIATKSQHPERYEHAAAAVKGYGYASWTDFYRNGNEDQARTIIADLRGPKVAEPVPA